MSQFRLSLPSVSGSSKNAKYLGWFDLHQAAWRRDKKSPSKIELYTQFDKDAQFFLRMRDEERRWPEIMVSVSKDEGHQAEIVKVVFINAWVRVINIRGESGEIIFEADRPVYKIGSRAIW